ncbi:tetratricopeptide repeat protein [Corallococcus praedator]|uniref:Tetratricopeptide repeat protein n=1 Tax=Corallococcus praedator TaxID=2316724 RepID=A0ABX9Q8G4_9BACT|nr:MULTISPECIES: tetratricopeptide repeat protein [Corallococcus]RKH03375.1 tetratricopeptide repeat protein [Corallococcus sp. CA047B]RKH20706.1 tetratricopeptide repeat protein [Corallococcus sp. CA031C]RKH93672.1 tetratricopeptide repeat protein [Corallococcus praedator]
MRGVLWVSAVALAIHLIPLFLPRNMPEQELAIARATEDIDTRLGFLVPLKTNDKATAQDLRTAAELLREGAPAQAHDLAVEAERRDPTAVETQLLLARICDLERMGRCVEQALNKAVQFAPADPRADLLRADLSEQKGDLASATDALARAHERIPGDPLIGVRYGRLLSRMGQPDDALKVFSTLEGRMPPARLLVEQGLVLSRQGRSREAVKLLQQAVQADPKLAEGHFQLGLAWAQLGNDDAAEEALRRADRLNVEDTRPLATLCTLQVKAGRFEGARQTRTDLERRYPQRMDAIREQCRLP